MTTRRFYPWIVLVYACMMQVFTMGIIAYSFGLFVVPWMGEFHVQQSALMIAIAVCSVMSALLSPLAGILFDRVDAKRLILAGLVLQSVGLVVLSMVAQVPMLIGVYAVVFPVAIALAGPLVAFVLVARHFETKRGLALGLVALGASLGGFAMPLLVTWLLRDFNWREMLCVLAALQTVVVLIPGVFVLRRSLPPATPAKAESNGGGIRLALSRPVLLLGTAQLLPILMFSSVLYNVGAHALDIGLSQNEAALIMSTSMLFMAFGKVVTGAMSDRLNQRVMYVFVVSGLTFAMGFAAIAHGFQSMLAAVCLLSLMAGGVPPLTAAIVAGRWPPEQFGRVMGVVQALTALAATGPYIAAALREYTGSYTQAYLRVGR